MEEGKNMVEHLEPLYLHGIGHFHPENVIDNAFLASLAIGSDEQWILERVGICARRTVMSLDYIRATRNARPMEAAGASVYSNAQTGALAAQFALKRAGLELGSLGMVVAGGCSPQHSIPAEACVIAAELGIRVPAFDINSACSSFAVQTHLLCSMRPESLPDYILVVNAENNTRVIDYSDRRSAVLWGDGSSAAIFSPRVPSRFRVTASRIESDASGWDKAMIPSGKHFVQNGPAVQTFAIRKALATLAWARGRVRRNPERMYFIGHQANLPMLSSVCKRAEIPHERHLYNVEQFGNQGAAGAPTVLSQNWERFSAGDEIAMVVVGSGLTWGGLLIEVGE
jgi:3-oxoacyl-[acyl-carrier-protein] synthase-3